MIRSVGAMCEPIVWRKCGSLDVSEPSGCPLPVTKIVLSLLGGNVVAVLFLSYVYPFEGNVINNDHVLN
jgi:hypothetical protein